MRWIGLLVFAFSWAQVQEMGQKALVEGVGAYERD